MCGIAGIVGEAATTERIDRMVAQLGHRGPDGRGSWRAPGIALGHTRLAILDPEPHSGQPFWSEDARRVCTYNGEIYNYPQLRRVVGPLRTSCDTELLVEWSLSALTELCAKSRGMFAFAVHDTATGRTVATRDRLAIKPLYLAETHGGVVFASELRAILASGLVEGRLKPSTVADVLRYGAMVHPRTPFEGVQKADPGVLVGISNGDVVDAAPCDAPTLECPGDLVAALRQSVQAHLLADVEVGLFLSSGIDSSLLARCLADLGVRGRAITLRAQGVRDEANAARQTAAHYGLDAEVIELSEEECLQLCLEYFEAMDAPAADGLNTFLIARAAARAGLKVCLSGAGGDEMFGGYSISSKLRTVSRVRAVPPSVRGMASRLLTFGSTKRPVRRLAAAVEAAGTNLILDLAHRVFLEEEVKALVTPQVDLSASFLESDDRRGYLRDVLLADADVFGMASGVEIRVPFVDGPFMAAVARARAPVTKATVVNAFRDEFLARKLRQRKLGFTLPVDRWLRGPLRALVDRLLEDPPSCLSQYIDPGGVATHVHSWRSSLGPHASETWALISLYQWGDRHDARMTKANSTLLKDRSDSS